MRGHKTNSYKHTSPDVHVMKKVREVCSTCCGSGEVYHVHYVDKGSSEECSCIRSVCAHCNGDGYQDVFYGTAFCADSQ